MTTNEATSNATNFEKQVIVSLYNSPERLPCGRAMSWLANFKINSPPSASNMLLSSLKENASLLSYAMNWQSATGSEPSPNC
jgi:hypothetical protein